jgi:hypothetical protein
MIELVFCKYVDSKWIFSNIDNITKIILSYNDVIIKCDVKDDMSFKTFDILVCLKLFIFLNKPMSEKTRIFIETVFEDLLFKLKPKSSLIIIYKLEKVKEILIKVPYNVSKERWCDIKDNLNIFLKKYDDEHDVNFYMDEIESEMTLMSIPQDVRCIIDDLIISSFNGDINVVISKFNDIDLLLTNILKFDNNFIKLGCLLKLIIKICHDGLKMSCPNDVTIEMCDSKISSCFIDDNNDEPIGDNNV